MGRITTPALSRLQLALLGRLKAEPGRVVGFEELASAAGVAGSSIYQRMFDLRRVAADLGYEIDSVYGRGYRLIAWPDEEIPA
jgi:biotin operon repressor